MSVRKVSFAIAAVLVISAAATACAQSSYGVAWGQQFGANNFDAAYSVAVDATGNAFVTGEADGSLGGNAFLRKYDTSGNVLWTHQLSDDAGYSVAMDATGNAFVTGATGSNTFLCKYGTSGNALWTQQFSGSGYSVAVDAIGNAFVTGQGASAFLRKCDTSGNVLWTQQFGGDSTSGNSVAVDAAGNAFVAGNTFGSLGGTNQGGSDVFLRKYDTLGNVLWTKQFGTTGMDFGWSTAVDAAGNVFIAGSTSGGLPGAQGSGNAFLCKCDASGNVLWTQQFGTGGAAIAESVVVNAAGKVFVTGQTGANAFLYEYGTTGNVLWTQQFGAGSNTIGNSAGVDAAGNVFVAGYTNGSLFGPNLGDYDAYLAKFSYSGDANGDGTVNGADLNIVLSNYNQTGMTWAQGDFNGDSTVNGADLNIVLSNYNQSATVGAAVPEPSTLLLAVGGLVGLLAYAWRKK